MNSPVIYWCLNAWHATVNMSYFLILIQAMIFSWLAAYLYDRLAQSEQRIWVPYLCVLVSMFYGFKYRQTCIYAKVLEYNVHYKNSGMGLVSLKSVDRRKYWQDLSIDFRKLVQILKLSLYMNFSAQHTTVSGLRLMYFWFREKNLIYYLQLIPVRLVMLTLYLPFW